jgi:hypothetical protein
VKRIALIAVLGVVAAGCGSGSTAATIYTIGPTKRCVAGPSLGITFLPNPDDFVASTASGGSVRMHLAQNDVTVLFGASTDEASNLADAYRRFHAKHVGIEDILRTNNNVVLLWKFHPTSGDEANVNNCLK